jgi:hypothetical protein
MDVLGGYFNDLHRFTSKAKLDQILESIEQSIKIKDFSLLKLENFTNTGAFQIRFSLEHLNFSFYVQEFPGCCAYITVDNVYVYDWKSYDDLNRGYQTVLKVMKHIGYILKYTYLIFTTTANQDINRNLEALGAQVIDTNTSIRTHNTIRTWKLACGEL